MSTDPSPSSDPPPTFFSDLSHWFGRVAVLLFAWLVLVVAFATLEPTLNRWTMELGARPVPSTRQASARTQAPRTDVIGCTAVAAPSAASAASATLSDGAQPAVARREIHIDLRDGAQKLERSISLERCGESMTRLREAMSRWTAEEEEQQEIRGEAFGFVSVEGASLRYAVPSLQADGEDQTLTTVVDSAIGTWYPGRVTGNSYEIQLYRGRWDAGTTRVVVKHDKETQVWSRNPPGRTGEDEMEWSFSGRDSLGQTLRIFPPQPVADKGSAERRTPAEPLLVRAASGRLDLLRPLWLGVTYVLPFLALLWWAGRNRAGAEGGAELADALAAGCRAAVALIAVLMVAEAGESLGRIDSQDLRDALGLRNLWWSSSMLKCALLALAWPLFARAIGRSTVGRSGAASAAIGAMLVFGACAAILWDKQLPHLDALFDAAHSLRARLDEGHSLDDVGGLWLFAALGVGLILAAWAVSRALVGGSLLLASILLLGAAILMVLERRVGLPRSSLLGVAAALPFGWAFARASRTWIPRTTSDTRRPADSIGFLVLGALIAALLAAPIDLDRAWAFSSLLSSAAWSLARLWQIPALVLLVCWLARRGNDASTAGDHRHVQTAGALLVFALFYWRPQVAWLPLAASAAVGMFLVTRWLFRDHRAPPAQWSRPRRLARAIAYIRGYHRLQRLSQSLRKGLVAKIEKGESTLQAARELAEPMDRLVDQRAGTARSQRRRLLRALNEGSPQSPWHRGASGALLATAIGLPWIVSYLASTLHGAAPTNAEVLSRLCVAVLDVMRWPALGFFFLYFYPQLRGSNGIEKGLALAITLLLPQLAAISLDPLGDDTQWRALAFWSLQIFIACMVLGVALGDLGALRQAGRRAGSLIEIYNLGTLAAWSSSLAVAVGAAVVTAMASGAGALFTTGLKLLLPELQPAH